MKIMSAVLLMLSLCVSVPEARIAIQGNTLWYVSAQGLVALDRRDDSYTVYSFNPPFSVYPLSIAVDKNDVKWITSKDGVLRFDGNTWSLFTEENGLSATSTYRVAVDSNNVKWLATERGISRYDGVSWSAIGNDTELGDQKVLTVAVDKNNVKWFGTEYSGLYSYNDTTLTKHPLVFGDTTYTKVTAIAVDAHNTKWIGAQRSWGYPSSHTIDYEQALISLNDSAVTLLPNTASVYPQWPGWTIDTIAPEDGIIWYSDAMTLQKYDTSDNTRTPVDPGLSDNFGIGAIAVDDVGKVWIVSHSGLKSYDGTTRKSYTFDYPTSVEDHEKSPSALRITGNHPNPFNPSTTISFTLSRPGQTRLSVYDASGQKVRELASGHLSAGAHSAVWDGRDDSGRTVSSGVYLSRLESGGIVNSAKMLLMK